MIRNRSKQLLITVDAYRDRFLALRYLDYAFDFVRSASAESKPFSSSCRWSHSQFMAAIRFRAEKTSFIQTEPKKCEILIRFLLSLFGLFCKWRQQNKISFHDWLVTARQLRQDYKLHPRNHESEGNARKGKSYSEEPEVSLAIYFGRKIKY